MDNKGFLREFMQYIHTLMFHAISLLYEFNQVCSGTAIQDAERLLK